MSVVCPACGSTQLRTITPGYYECENQVLIGVVPPGPGQPNPLPDYRMCGRRFQTGAQPASELCACGRFAIGLCHGCRKPLCGEHGSRGSPFLCTQCYARAMQAQAAREQSLAASAAQRIEQARADVQTATDPGEIVGLLAVLANDLASSEPCRGAWVRLVQSGALRAPDCDVVQMRFRRTRMKGREVSELSRRAGWRDAAGKDFVLGEDGSLWSRRDHLRTYVPEAFDHIQRKMLKYTEHAFTVVPGAPAQMDFKVDGAVYWRVLDGAAVLDISNYRELPEVVARITGDTVIRPTDQI